MVNLTLKTNAKTNGYSCLISADTFLSKLQALTSSSKLLIAYSGGLDSHVLLHLAAQLAHSKHYSVRAMHVHHGLQDAADSWVPHCQKVSDHLMLPLEVVHLNLAIEKGESIEEAARTARYSVFHSSLQEDEILLTAHHQNDQAETLLLQLFRGAGVRGLAAMPLISAFGLGKHARPLLDAPRDALEAYAQSHQLSFIQDPSNAENAFDRNYLRNEILPKLRKRWSGIDKTISRSASIQAETKQVLDEVAAHDLLSMTCACEGSFQSKGTVCLELAKLEALSEARQKLVLRYWIDSNGFRPPSEKKLKHIFTDAIYSKDDAQPVVSWNGVELRRFKNRLYLMLKLQDFDNKQVLLWKEPQHAFYIKSLDIEIPGLPESFFEKSQDVTVRFRQGGERFYDAKRGLTISLKNLLNESSVPPWLRSRIPLIYSGDALVKIVGIE